MPQETFWLPYLALGALQGPGDANAWAERIHDSHGAAGIALVMLPIAPELPASVERRLIDVLVEADRSTGTVSRLLALHLYRSHRLSTVDKTRYLHRLGMNGDPQAREEAIQYLGWLAEDQQQAEWLHAVLERHLLEGTFNPDAARSHGVGSALKTLGQLSPDRLADLLIKWHARVTGNRRIGLPLLPHDWEYWLRELPRNAREVITAALLDELCASPQHPRGEEIEFIHFFGHDTEALLQHARRLQACGEPGKDRLIQLLTRSWNQPEYVEITAQVIDSGISTNQYRRLQLSLRPMAIGAGEAEEIAELRTALAPLSGHPSFRVQTFATDALNALDRAEREEAERADRDARGYS